MMGKKGDDAAPEKEKKQYRVLKKTDKFAKIRITIPEGHSTPTKDNEKRSEGKKGLEKKRGIPGLKRKKGEGNASMKPASSNSVIHQLLQRKRCGGERKDLN